MPVTINSYCPSETGANKSNSKNSVLTKNTVTQVEDIVPF